MIVAIGEHRPGASAYIGPVYRPAILIFSLDHMICLLDYEKRLAIFNGTMLRL